MAFENSIYTLMTSNATLNAYVGEIYYQIIPDNTPLSAITVVYTFSLIDSIDHLARNNEIDIYTLTINILAQDTNTLNTAMGYVRAFMDNYSASPFRDVKIINSEVQTEGEREQFVGTLTYKIHFQN